MLVPDSDNLKITGDLSIDAWINSQALGSGQTVVSKYESDLAGGGVSYVLLLLGSESDNAGVRFAVYENKEGSIHRVIDSDAAVVPAGVFSHVSGTFELASEDMKIYVNGVEVPATLTSASTTITSIYSSTSPVRIGAFQDSSGSVGTYFQGIIDEVEIFNRTLTDAEILAIYESGSAGKCKIAPATRFNARLSGDEVPSAVETPAKGIFRARLDETGTQLQYQVLVGRIRGVTAAHIHCAPLGENGAAGVTLYDGDPVDIRRGVLAAGSVLGPDAANGCGWETFDDVLAGLRSGDTYVNVHTETWPGGEIRGQIEPLIP